MLQLLCSWMSWIFLKSSVLLTQVFFKIPFYGILWGCTHVLCGFPTVSTNPLAASHRRSSAVLDMSCFSVSMDPFTKFTQFCSKRCSAWPSPLAEHQAAFMAEFPACVHPDACDSCGSIPSGTPKTPSPLQFWLTIC